ncbi:MAG: hypothetical protein KGJ07_10495 [Patescibacteria group bacterium]|nr:hypothetical protein [Patescibacteria group bacterium]
MTQTFRKIENGNYGSRKIGIYADHGRGKTFHKYDVLVEKIPACEAAEWAIEELKSSDDGQHAEVAVKILKRVLAVSRNGFVWRVFEGDGKHDLCLTPDEEFHGSRKSAMEVAESQFC